MSHYKQASRQGWRFKVGNSTLNVEKLWQLDLTTLDTLAVELEEQTSSTPRKSFLTTENETNVVARKRFELVKDILDTKLREQNAALKAVETKAQNARIASLIQQKEDEALAGKSIEELKEMLQ
jgi:hypothetical protein